jgi:16S rRNA (uracil1498-N3)-methyltransferase
VQRLFINTKLYVGAEYECNNKQANYLLNVLGMRKNNELLVFNGHDGEWLASVANSSRPRRGSCLLVIGEQIRKQDAGQDIVYLFAPLKRARLDYMVQKATEMGVSGLQPVFTSRTSVGRIKLERMRANVIEAAEQCGIMQLPQVYEPRKLARLLAGWDTRRHLIYCDEMAEVRSPFATLGKLAPGPLAILVGPEGGFDEDERSLLNSRPFVTAISLGPRIMRADTAAVAALALVNSILGEAVIIE